MGPLTPASRWLRAELNPMSLHLGAQRPGCQCWVKGGHSRPCEPGRGSITTSLRTRGGVQGAEA